MTPSFLTVQRETQEEFAEIANLLLNNYAIQNHESLYRLTDIEFYWYSPKHQDESTYKRKHVNPNHGDWFFHYSGVDIALKNDEIGGFGGILIRGIYSLKEQKKYNGPMVCAMKLFSGINAFSADKMAHIINHTFKKASVLTKPRVNLGQNAVESGTAQLNYRFLIHL